jgi:plasmid maintenance system killer protein
VEASACDTVVGGSNRIVEQESGGQSKGPAKTEIVVRFCCTLRVIGYNRRMNVRHVDSKLERPEIDSSFRGGFDHKIIKAYRKTMAIIRAAEDEQVFYALKGLHYEKRSGNRSHRAIDETQSPVSPDPSSRRGTRRNGRDYQHQGLSLT